MWCSYSSFRNLGHEEWSNEKNLRDAGLAIFLITFSPMPVIMKNVPQARRIARKSHEGILADGSGVHGENADASVCYALWEGKCSKY